MRFRYTALCVALAVAAGLSTATIARETPPDLQKQIEAARAADQTNNGPEAVRLWTPLAEQGLPEAQTSLGVAYTYGVTVCKNQSLALNWLTKAADQGYAKAYYLLGRLYDDGTGAFDDKARAVDWYQKAADTGDVRASETLGILYANGTGVPRDRALAVSWTKKAADQRRQGGDGAMAALDTYVVGNIYAGDKDYRNAETWYQLAANAGSLEAMDELAAMYEDGKTVRRDYVAAYRWYAVLAAYDKSGSGQQAESYKTEVAAQKRLAAKMTPAQLRKARTLASETRRITFPPRDMPRVTPVVYRDPCPAS